MDLALRRRPMTSLNPPAGRGRCNCTMQAASASQLPGAEPCCGASGRARAMAAAAGFLGLALPSEHRYAQQDYGGPLQGVLTWGVTLPLLRPFGLGYRFVHYSDAGAYGPGTIGADFHMIELTHRF